MELPREKAQKYVPGGKKKERGGERETDRRTGSLKRTIKEMVKQVDGAELLRWSVEMAAVEECCSLV